MDFRMAGPAQKSLQASALKLAACSDRVIAARSLIDRGSDIAVAQQDVNVVIRNSTSIDLTEKACFYLVSTSSVSFCHDWARNIYPKNLRFFPSTAIFI